MNEWQAIYIYIYVQIYCLSLINIVIKEFLEFFELNYANYVIYLFINK